MRQLERATTTDALKRDREHLLRVSEEFQDRVMNLFELFAVIAHKSILERNELGEYIVRSWGTNDHRLLADIRRNRRSNPDLVRKLEQLLAWNKSAEPVGEIIPHDFPEVTCA